MVPNRKLAILPILFFFLISPATFAADDGNTRPRLSNGAVNSGTADIINQSSVAGNVKGVSCNFVNTASANLIFTVNGGTAQTINMPWGVPDVNGDRHTGWIPMNIRFTSSIRVQIQFAGGIGLTDCDVSWALD